MAHVHTFKTERDVRAWVKGQTKDPLWVEPNRGSTVGTPDVFTLDAGGVWIELKLGVCKDRRLLKWKLRPRQYWAMSSIRSRGLRCALLVGFANKIFVTCDPEAARKGWGEIRAEDLDDPRDPGTWAKIMEKVVSDCSVTEK